MQLVQLVAKEKNISVAVREISMAAYMITKVMELFNTTWFT